ncbi:Gfo/Idh/MocA family oxidoreductase, partial [Chloroflexi bacterium TSY]|nr:Gfo/Idh/MocA family oxidoreductase [Chloroflexi bacterium TSY]
ERKAFMTDLKVGVIGCGRHARSHFEMIAAEPRMSLIAIAEMNEERLAQAKAAHQPEFAFRDYRDMLDQAELDVVYVVTTPGPLLQIVLDCLARGLHTSVEKPPGMNIGATRQMRDAARKSKGKAILSVNRRYKPEILAVRHLLQERGSAVHVAANYHKGVSGFARPEHRDSAPPAIVYDAIHHVDLLRWLAGRSLTEAATVSEVYAQSWHGAREGTPRYNAIIGFDNGCRGTMMSQYGVGYRIQTAEVHAEDMSAYLDLTQTPKIALYLDGQPYNEPLDIEAVVPAHFNETRHFADCILNDTTPWSDLEDAMQTMALCEAIEQGHQGSLAKGI